MAAETIKATVQRMAASGLSVREIAERLVVVKTMTERHLRNLLKDDKCNHKK